jgi:FlaA1/EpsC-like NDP-sugar epimerase
MEPGELVLLGRGENRIFDIEEAIRQFDPPFPVVSVINDLRDPQRTDRLIRSLAPEIIYHTAAHKHVHYMEREPEEAVLNNVGASVNLIRAAEAAGTKRFVFISTDKAANPTGVMGATKRMVELYMRARPANGRCRLITVRFGNVIGSTGSVVPHFLKQIHRGGPVTVSDPNATRYFMTVKEASLLVIRASLIGTGGETYILEMGDPLNILDMARDIVELSGREPDAEIPIVVTGLREGEKLHEELVCDDETLVQLDEEKILLARSNLPVPPDVGEGIEELVRSARLGDRRSLFAILSRYIPSFERTR